MRTLLFKTLAQKAAASNFYFSKEVKLILIIFFLANVSLAQIKTSKLSGGRWSDASTWVEGSIPGPGDAVTIVAGSSVVIRTSTDGLILNGVSDPATCTSLIVNGVLTLGSGGGSGSKYLNVSDFVTISNGGVLTNDAVELHRLNIGGNFTNNGTFNPIIGTGLIQTTFNGAGAQVIDGLSSNQTFYSFTVQKSGGALTTSSNVTNLTASFFTLSSGDFVAPSSLTSSGTLTLTAGTYTAGANTFLGGNFTNNGVSFVPGTGTVTFNGSGTQTIGGSTTNPQFYNITTNGSNTLISGSVSGIVTLINGNLVVGDGTTFQVARPLTVKGTTTIGNGTSGKLLISSLDGAKTFEGRVTISSGGTWDNDDVNENARFYNGITNNGTFIAGSGLYNFEVNSQSIEGVISIPLIDVATGVTLTNNGTFTVSTDLAGQGSLVQGNNAQLNVGGALGILSLSATGTNNTVNYTGGAQTVKGNPYVNLGLSGNGAKTLTALTVTISGNLTLSETATTTTVNNLTIGGSLSIGTGSSLTNGVSRTLTVGNSLSGDGTLAQSSNSILNINGGSTLASLSASAAGNTVNYNAVSPIITPSSYHNLFLNQSSGNASLNGNTSVAGALTLNTGSLVLGANNLTLGASAVLSISSPSASRMIIASGAGELRRTFLSTGSFVFPIGDNTATLEYSPVTVNITSATGFSSAYVGVSLVNAKHPSNASTTHFLSRYWNITQSGITTCVATISGTYPAADINGTESSIKAAQLNGAFNQTGNPWIKYAFLASGSMSITGATLTAGQTSAFTGITGADPVVSIGGDVSICPGSSVPLSSSVTGDPIVLYSWSPITGLSAANVANPTASPSITTDYTLTVIDGNGQSSVSAPKKVTVSNLPSTPTAVATAQPTCSISTGEITVNSSVTGLSFSIDGTDYTNTTGVFAGLAPNNYTITAKNGAGCISAASSPITIEVASGAPAAPIASATTQPTCSIATGVITISSSLTGLSFSIDGSDYTNTTGVFTGLAPNNYTITAKNGAGCISAASSTITINAQPATPAAPTASATAQPTCSVATGVITVSSSLTGLSFSIDGSDYTNTTGVFAGLIANNYTVTAKNGAGCISSASSALTINAQPVSPVAPTASATAQPTCSISTGEITVSSSLTGLSFSIDGSNYTNTTGVFTELTPNDYIVTAKNGAGCVSAGSSTITINAAIGAPTAPTASATVQPTCSVATGEITVSSSLTGLSFSIDGTDYTNTTGVFTGLVANNYTVTAKNGGGCISASSTITINAQPATPAAPTASATAQPTCSVATGVITVTSSLTGLSFSIDGSDYTNTTGVFTGLTSNNYTLTAKNGAGCISSASSTITINVQPATPAVPTATATVQPTCTVPTGEITVSSSLTGLSFSIDGSDYTNTTGVFTGLTPGDYIVTAKNGAGCASAASSTITINVAIGAPAAPTASATAQPTCIVATGEITVSSDPTGLSFSIDGSDFTNTTGLFTALVPGNYTVTAKNAAECISTTPTITINAQPATPAAPTASATTQPTCIVTTGEITVSSDLTGLSFSIDGSDYTNTTGVFTGLASGNYTVTAKNVAGCISSVSSTITINAPPAPPSVNTPSAALCVGATMTASPSTGGTWVSSTPGVATINSTTGLVTGVSVGTVTFTFTSTATGCSNTTSSVTVSPLPGKPVITTSNILTETPTLTSSSNTGNQWFKDNVAITGATSKTLTVSASGSYTVQVTTNGCSSVFSDAVAIVITGIEQRIISNRSAIYPNPAKEVIQIDWSDFASDSGIEIKIYDQVGRLIITKVMTSSDNSLDVRSLEQGSYVFLARQNGTLLIQRFIKN